MPSDFDPERHRLRPLAVAEIAGLVFASFHPEPIPIDAYLGERVRTHLLRVLSRPVRIIGRCTQVLPCNWKLYVENVKDSYHASILHAFFTTFRLNRLSQSGEIVVDESGGNHVSYSRTDPSLSNAEYEKGELRSNVAGYGLEDPAIIDAVDEFGDGIGLQILTVFPGFVLHQIRNSLAVRQVLPRGPERTELHCTYLGFADDDEAMLTRRLRQANLVGPAGYVSMEDGAVGGFVQRAVRGVGEDRAVVMMGGRDARSSPSRVTEASVRGFWKKYRALLG
jgi:anthranilate 1,2-dioxygenase large subunit/terephthalate 1,2-dioxygenase oxygenase component alpha subunit